MTKYELKYEWLEILMYLVFGIICLVIVVVLNGKSDNRCVEKGGQIIHNSTELNHGCIMPPGIK